MEPEKARTFGARFQGMLFNEQSLALCRIAEGRNTDGSVQAKEIEDLFDAIGLPPPPRVRDTFKALKDKGQLTPTSIRGRWRLTPKGREESSEQVSEEGLAQLLTENARILPASLGNQVHPLVPPNFAPASIALRVRDFVRKHPFDLNVFAMTRFPEEMSASDPVYNALQEARRAVSQKSFELHTAADQAIVDDLWGNVTAHIWASRYGIAILENRTGRGLNYNMSIELGAMLTLGRRCLLLKDSTIETIPTDLTGRICKSVDIADLQSIYDATTSWIENDLGVAALGQQ